MNIETAVILTKMKLEELGLMGFTVAISNRKSAAGDCRTTLWSESPSRRQGTIRLSSALIPGMPEAEAIDTILHEIGHALTDPKHDPHGPEWRANAMSIGGTGRATLKGVSIKMDYKYIGVCRNGHKTRKHRLTEKAKTRISCGKCSNEPNEYYMFNWYDSGQLVHRNY